MTGVVVVSAAALLLWIKALAWLAPTSLRTRDRRFVAFAGRGADRATTEPVAPAAEPLTRRRAQPGDGRRWWTLTGSRHRRPARGRLVARLRGDAAQTLATLGLQAGWLLLWFGIGTRTGILVGLAGYAAVLVLDHHRGYGMLPRPSGRSRRGRRGRAGRPGPRATLTANRN